MKVVVTKRAFNSFVIDVPSKIEKLFKVVSKKMDNDVVLEFTKENLNTFFDIVEEDYIVYKQIRRQVPYEVMVEKSLADFFLNYEEDELKKHLNEIGLVKKILEKSFDRYEGNNDGLFSVYKIDSKSYKKLIKIISSYSFNDFVEDDNERLYKFFDSFNFYS